jgi:hypothetical protein
MFITFPVLGHGLETIDTRIWLSDATKIPTCSDCGQTMNELYIISSCDFIDKIHIHFSHRHYEQNQEYRTHYCMEKEMSYRFPPSH